MMVDRIVDVHILIPETCEYVITLHVKMGFADVMKDLEIKEIILDFLDWLSVITSVLKRQKKEAEKSEML